MIHSDNDRYVHVALPGRTDFVVAGRFRVSGTDRDGPLGEFVYERSYLTRRGAVELDPVQLRLTEHVRRTRSCHGLFGALRDATPETWGVLQVLSDGNVCYGKNRPARGPRDHAGAIVVTRGSESPRPKRRFKTIDDLDQLQTVVGATLEKLDARQETGTPRALEPPVIRRPTATVADGRTLWLAKFAQDQAVWNHARIRHATLQLGQACGLDTACSRVESTHGQDILLLRRADREWMGDGYTCRRVISGRTLVSTLDKPAEQRWSYLALADEIRRVRSCPRKDLRELFGRICFNAAISNLDDNLDPPAMIAKGRGWRLTPASGLAPTPLPEGEGGNLVMICGPGGCSPSRENIVSGAGRFLLDRPTAEAVFTRISVTVQASWYAVMRRCGVSERDCELVARSIVPDGDTDSKHPARAASSVRPTSTG